MSIDGDLPMKSLRRPTRVERHLFAILVASVAIFGDVRTANGGIVAIWVNDTVTGWQQMAVDPTGEIAAVGSYTTLNGAFNLTNSYAAMTDGPNADINSSTFHLQHIGNGSDSLAIAVIGTNFTSPTKAPIFVQSQVSGINSLGSLTALTFQSYVDSTNNGIPGFLSGGQGLQTPTIYPTITGPGASLETSILTDLSAPFSVAQLFTLAMTGDGQVVSLGGETALSPMV
jgi:hypothetical protein